MTATQLNSYSRGYCQVAVNPREGLFYCQSCLYCQGVRS